MLTVIQFKKFFNFYLHNGLPTLFIIEYSIIELSLTKIGYFMLTVISCV